MQAADERDRLGFLSGAGEMARMMRAYDWSRSPLGPPESWPQSLKTVIRIMLTSRYAMWMAWGPDLTFFCNDSYLPTVGIKRDWVLGSRSDLVWEEIWPDIGPRIDRVLKTGEATWDDSLLLFLERSGFSEETYHTFSYSPLSDDGGKIAGMLCVVTEVTDRIIGERRLASLSTLGGKLAAARSEAEVVDAVAAGLATATKDLPFSLLYLKENGDGEYALARAIGVDDRHPAAPRVLTADGPWKIGNDVLPIPAGLGDMPRGPWHQPPKLAVTVPIAPQGQEEPIGLLIAGLNPHRAYDAPYANFIDLVSGQIAAALAGAKVYEEQRRRAQALAEIDRAKTVFFSNVSHEFRTPLTLMLGPLEDALHEVVPRPDLQRERISVAHRNALRLLRLVNSLLDFSRIEAGRVKANFQNTDILALTADLASNFRSATERAGLLLDVESERLAGDVFVDRDMWEKIVLNLLSNAFKFTFEGKISVHVRDAPDRAGAQLVVSDTGVGIPEDELPHLFERFHRVEHQKSRSFEGTGIGLALIHELVKLHGGSIGVESRSGSGTSFTVTIPFGAAHLPSEQVDTGKAEATTSLRAEAIVQEALHWLPEEPSPEGFVATEVSAADPVGSSVPGRILVVDDNTDMRTYIQGLLGKHWEIVGASDGLAALDAIKNGTPDLVVTDAMMPNLDGFGLLAAIRADPVLRDIPVIMLSARAGEEARIGGLEAGADYYLTKPFLARELIAQVNANLKVAQMRRETTRRLEKSAGDLSRRTTQYETLLNRAPLGVYVVNADFRIIEVNPAALPVFGDIDVVGRDFAEVMHILWLEPYAAELVKLFRHTLETGEPYVTDERIEHRADRGQLEYYEWQIHRIAMPDGRFGVVCYFRDISMTVRARTQRELLINELNHRVKNTLTTIQSMTSQTLRGAGIDRQVYDALEARLISMAGAHDILTQESWSGADLADIVARALFAFSNSDLLRIEGPRIRIAPSAALAIAMALHELATNAVKYGALSSNGTVDITWSIEDRQGSAWLHLTWVERDGPPVFPPSRQGFGSRLISRGLAGQLGGKAEINYVPTGVVCQIFAPLAKLTLPAASEMGAR